MEDLEKHCGEKVDIGNLYRTLRKMEMNSFVISEWDKNESRPNKRVYTVTKAGLEHLKEAVFSLTQRDLLIHKFLEGYQKSI